MAPGKVHVVVTACDAAMFYRVGPVAYLYNTNKQ